MCTKTAFIPGNYKVITAPFYKGRGTIVNTKPSVIVVCSEWGIGWQNFA